MICDPRRLRRVTGLRGLAIVGALASLVLATGCASPMGPDDLAGEYRLTRVDGATPGEHPRVARGRLTLVADGLFRLVIHERVEDSGELWWAGSWRLDDGRLHLSVTGASAPGWGGPPSQVGDVVSGTSIRLTLREIPVSPGESEMTFSRTTASGYGTGLSRDRGPDERR